MSNEENQSGTPATPAAGQPVVGENAGVTPTQPPAQPTVEQQIANLTEQRTALEAQMSTAQAGARLRILQSLLNVEMQIAKLNSAPQLQELANLKAERDALSKTISDMETNLLEIGAIERPKSEITVVRKSRTKAGTPEGQVLERVHTPEKNALSPQTRGFALIIKQAGSLSDVNLVEKGKLAGILSSSVPDLTGTGTLQVGLRGLRDVYHVIDFGGSPAGAVPTAEQINANTAEGQALQQLYSVDAKGTVNRLFKWIATEDQLAGYNEALKKAGRETI